MPFEILEKYISPTVKLALFFFALFLLKNVLENPDLQVTGGGWWRGKGEGRGRWGRALDFFGYGPRFCFKK